MFQRDGGSIYDSWKNKVGRTMESEEKATTLEHKNNESLTDEEFKKYQEEDGRTTKKVLRLFSVIWEAIVYFFT